MKRTNLHSTWVKLGNAWTICFLAANVCVFAQAKQFTAAEAKHHIGEHASVCGKVVDTRYAAKTRGAPTFLNLDKAYPNPIFTVVIWGESREKFGAPEEKYRNQQVCVEGEITNYRGTPEIVASDPAQIKIQAR